MKEYIVQYKELYDYRWLDIDYYNSLEEANERIAEEKRNEEDRVKGIYEYRILIYEAIES